MKFWTVILLSFLALLPVPMFGQKALSSQKVADVTRGIQEMNRKTKTISSSFIQDKHMSFLAETVKSSGKFFYQKEAKIRWVYEKPSAYIAIINDGRIHVDDGQHQNTIDTRSQKGFRELNDMMLQCINGTISNNENYDVKYVEDQQHYIVRLKPKSKNLQEFITQIDLFLNKTQFNVEAIRLTESADGDYTHIHFENQKFNQALDAALFTID